jgi:hypothetical protein
VAPIHCTNTLRIGVQWMAYGAAGWVLVDQVVGIGLRVPQGTPLAYYTGSPYGYVAMSAIVITMHGLILVMHVAFPFHPPFGTLSDVQRELIRDLELGKTNGEIAWEQHATAEAISQRLRKLCVVTNFHGDDQLKRRNLVAYYREQVKSYYHALTGSDMVFHPNCGAIVFNRGTMMASRMWASAEGQRHESTDWRVEPGDMLKVHDWLCERECTHVALWDVDG